MERKDITKLNKSSDAIWKLIQESVSSKNWATLTQNLNRLYKLQDYYCKLLNVQEWELKMLKKEEIYLNQKLSEFEKREIEELCKKSGTYQTFKKQIDELFQER